LWEKDDTNYLPKEFTSIISISSCPEAARCSDASCHRLGAARSAGVRRQTRPWYVPCSHCWVSAPREGTCRCSAMTSLPHQLGSKQTRSARGWEAAVILHPDYCKATESFCKKKLISNPRSQDGTFTSWSKAVRIKREAS